MADFHQSGAVTTLHRLNPDGLGRLEGQLEELGEARRIGLALPALYSEFETPAMRRIRAELAQVRYLRHIVVALGRADRERYERTQEFFRDFPQPVTILWIDSDRVQDLLRELDERGLSAGPDGKGRSNWLACGYLLATAECDVIASHDCDIVNYHRSLLARLCYPVAHPDLGFEFAKGYYARVTDRMHGRATRLFVTPLVRALKGIAPGAPFLEYLDSFRYPLAGEFAMDANLALVNRTAGGWGLEVGALAEVYRNCSLDRVCQVDVADNYEHKHQALSAEDPSRGLCRMAVDIAKSLFRTLAGEGLVLTKNCFGALRDCYARVAAETIERFYADAMLNGLTFDRRAEEAAVATFAKSLWLAAEEFSAAPLEPPRIPSWNAVVSAVPDVFERLRDAVAQDAGVAAACAA